MHERVYISAEPEGIKKKSPVAFGDGLMGLSCRGVVGCGWMLRYGAVRRRSLKEMNITTIIVGTTE
jgi:hypothetical protein